jgi:hypothetical protein
MHPTLVEKPWNTSSAGRNSAKSRRAGIGDQLLTALHGPVQIVVHDADRTEATALSQLTLSNSDPTLGLLRGIAATPETLGLDLGRGRLEKDEQRIGRSFENLGSALHIDLENHIPILAGLGPWGAIEIAEELGVLEEAATFDPGFELGSIDIGVGIVGFTGALLPGRPTA